MIKYVIKRTGRKVKFNKKKIYQAVLEAFKVCDDNLTADKEFANKIADEIESMNLPECMSVEDIQDLIEKKLMQSSRKDVAKVYINYRYLKDMARSQYKELIDAVGEKLKANNVQNQNANVDEHSFGGRVGEASSVITKNYALNYLVSDMAKNNHENNEIYIHDLDSYAVGSHNCLSIPFDELLANGFNTRQGDVRPAGSVSTAFQLVAVLFQLQSLQQFGGVSATHLDWTMVPYVRKSFYKHYIDCLNIIPFCKNIKLNIQKDKIINISIDDEIYTGGSFNLVKRYVHKKAKALLVKEIAQAVEGMYHNLNTLQSRSGNQLPFTSINYGTCTLTEGRMIIRALLEGSLKGIGKLSKTSIFPCGIFQCMKGVNRQKGDPNYDLFRLALKSTSQRVYPNYANVDWSGNEGYDINNPQTYFSTMGALDGKEHLYIKIGNEIKDISIKEFFTYCKRNETIKGRPCKIVFSAKPLSLLGKGKHNQDHNQKKCKTESGVYKITYLPQDVSYIGSSRNILQRWNEHRVSIRTTGGPDCGIKFADSDLNNYSFEVLEYCSDFKEKESYYIMNHANINVRSISKKYYKSVSRKFSPVYEKPIFMYDNSISQELIDLSDKNIFVLDRGNKWTKVNHIFRNDKLNTPQMMHIRYKEFQKIFELSCTEDHPVWTGNKFVRADQLTTNDCLFRADGLALPIVDISWHWEQVESYDIGTETGTFIGSDIIMHNCRTANGFDINGLGQQKDGRGNICPVTVILPTLAMEAKEAIFNQQGKEGLIDEDAIVDKFLEILNTKIEEAHDMLIERFEWICSQPPEAAKFMYENNVMAGYIPEEGIRSALRHGTLAIGQLGLAETLQILIGCDQTTEEGMKLAKKIEKVFKDKCAKFKKEYKLNFGVYYTPAENLCYTAMNKFRDKYGTIENVSDREYFTNSIHVPVWKDVTPYEKIDIESELTGYSSAGCITYVELDSTCKHNINALERIVNYAMDKDIPYFAVNVPNDTCLECGYTDEIGPTCPICGSDKIQRLRRVTGYLSQDYRNFNKGKIKEVEQRVKHEGIVENVE